MASGQATGITRMLAATIASDSTKATISSQVKGASHSVKAGTSSGCRARGRASGVGVVMAALGSRQSGKSGPRSWHGMEPRPCGLLRTLKKLHGAGQQLSIRAQEAAVIIAHPVPNPPREET